MDAANQLKEQCFFNLLMAVDRREERLSHIIVFTSVFFDRMNGVDLTLRNGLENFTPNDSLIKSFLDCIFFGYEIFLFIFCLEFIKLIVLYFYVHS